MRCFYVWITFSHLVHMVGHKNHACISQSHHLCAVVCNCLSRRFPKGRFFCQIPNDCSSFIIFILFVYIIVIISISIHTSLSNVHYLSVDLMTTLQKNGQC